MSGRSAKDEKKVFVGHSGAVRWCGWATEANSTKENRLRVASGTRKPASADLLFTVRRLDNSVNDSTGVPVPAHGSFFGEGFGMPKLTMVFGLLLCGVSVSIMIYLLGFAGGEVKSASVLIPMAVGIPLFILGLFAQIRPGARKHLMHAAVSLGLLGALAALSRGVPQLLKVVRGEAVDWLPVSTVWAMVIICVTYVLVCIESFISARKARQAAAAHVSVNDPS